MRRSRRSAAFARAPAAARRSARPLGSLVCAADVLLGSAASFRASEACRRHPPDHPWDDRDRAKPELSKELQPRTMPPFLRRKIRDAAVCVTSRRRFNRDYSRHLPAVGRILIQVMGPAARPDRTIKAQPFTACLFASLCKTWLGEDLGNQ